MRNAEQCRTCGQCANARFDAAYDSTSARAAIEVRTPTVPASASPTHGTGAATSARATGTAGTDELSTAAAARAHRRHILDAGPAHADLSGRTNCTLTIVDALSCNAMRARNAHHANARRLGTLFHRHIARQTDRTR
jgi:hypothetical protein